MIPRPTPTGRKGEGDRAHCEIYLDAEGKPLLWSGKFPLPNIGDRLTITMNRIGPAEVVGYFSEAGYVGVMTKALDPPTWLVKQRADDRKRPDFAGMPQWWKDDIGCEFGAEVALPPKSQCPTL